MKKLKTQYQYNLNERNGQLVFALNTEICLPEDSPVRLLSAQLEELDYSKLYLAYSAKGRKSVVDPRVLFKVTVYGYMKGIISSRQLEDACRNRIDFMWLLEGQTVPDHTTLARFRTGRCSAAVEELFYQFVKKLEDMEETDHGAVFIDGTKLESRAGRYTFCWKKGIEKKLARVQERLFKLSSLEDKNDNQAWLAEWAQDIRFVHGKGHHKSPEQREWEKASELLERWEKYEDVLETIGPGRNSCSKTDPDATFMRMKEDHMRNGQLKPGYNVQIAVNSEYITGLEVFSDRNDVHTLKPFLRKLEQKQQKRYKEVVADAGYESLENYLYLEQTGQTCFIKPTNYYEKDKAAFKRQIGRMENMQYDPEQDCFVCNQGRTLLLRREKTEQNNGQLVSTAWYRCENCSNCPCRSLCCRAKDPNQPKEVMVQKTFWEKRKETTENIVSEHGIQLRICRSIQVEGAFALLKNDFGFRRFLTIGKTNIRTELFFLALAFDLKKLWMKQQKGRLKTRVSEKLIS